MDWATQIFKISTKSMSVSGIEIGKRIVSWSVVTGIHPSIGSTFLFILKIDIASVTNIFYNLNEWILLKNSNNRKIDPKLGFKKIFMPLAQHSHRIKTHLDISIIKIILLTLQWFWRLAKKGISKHWTWYEAQSFN